MVDSDIALYFGVTTGNLNKAMKRNIKPFPEKFCFQMTNEECSRFQIGILNGGRGSNLKYLPYVYTEQGLSYTVDDVKKTLYRPKGIDGIEFKEKIVIDDL